ncbi:hypothetical protein RND81_13G159000 [Saponaria officinalis]|uniref:F-box domain-containing protein n=1 Tax=Saponaria officinalis TaxID=3572 RepID=A0AAW1H0G9_SAPOF
METTRILPDDILEDILVRLPAKILVRWKCVSKHWYALFGDYNFAMKHYRFQYAHHATVPLFLNCSLSYPTQTKFFLLSKHGGDDVVLNVTPDFHRDIRPAFANESELSFLCMGIVNGVICL